MQTASATTLGPGVTSGSRGPVDPDDVPVEGELEPPTSSQTETPNLPARRRHDLTSWPGATSELGMWDGVQPDHSDTGTIRAAVLPRIADVDLVLPGNVVAYTEMIVRDIAAWNAHVGALWPHFGGMSTRMEGIASARIDGTSMGSRALVEAELDEIRHRDALDVAGAVMATHVAAECALDWDASAFQEIHHAAYSPGGLAEAGALRDGVAWAGRDHHPLASPYIPPLAHHLPEALEDISVFMMRDDMPVVMQASLTFAQFSNVYPFRQGTDRVARALIATVLQRRGVATTVRVPVSVGLLWHGRNVVATVDAFREGHPIPMIEMMCDSLLRGITAGKSLIKELADLRDEWLPQVRGNHARSVAELLFHQPVITVRRVYEETGMSPRVVQRCLDKLTEAGLVEEASRQGRNRVWNAPHVLDLIDSHMEDSLRRFM